jgi:hypothetical protein
MSQGKCLAQNCINSTQRVFCGSCFHKLDGDLKRRLQIGATKTRRNPTDRRAGRKYALVVADAIDVLGEQGNDDEEENSNKEKGNGEEASSAENACAS